MAMNGRIVAIDDSTHEKVQKLLPWFVVDTLTGEELELVNQHLHVCAECQADFAWQCKLQAIAPASDTHPDVDRALAKLRPRLGVAVDKPRQRPMSGLFDRFLRGNPQWMPWALAAQFSVIIVLVAVIATPFGNIAAYRALGTNKDTGGNMVVVFKPETREQDLRRILQHAGARIVDGPTVTDAYLLHVPEEKLNGTVHDLRVDPAVVLAEPLGSGGKQ